MQTWQLPLLSSAVETIIFPVCLWLPYSEELPSQVCRLVTVVLSSCWENWGLRAPVGVAYSGTAVLTALQLVLHRNGMHSLHAKQISDVALLLPWTGYGFSCPCSGKGKFSHQLYMPQFILVMAHLIQVAVMDAGVEDSLQHSTESLRAKELKQMRLQKQKLKPAKELCPKCNEM